MSNNIERKQKKMLLKFINVFFITKHLENAGYAHNKNDMSLISNFM